MISKRLKVIADMVDTKSIIDVGCDHALLDIYLAKQRDIECLAIDVREGIIRKILDSVKQEKLVNKIKVKLNNGLENININNDDTVILSGLGTNTILNIIFPTTTQKPHLSGHVFIDILEYFNWEERSLYIIIKRILILNLCEEKTY